MIPCMIVVPSVYAIYYQFEVYYPSLLITRIKLEDTKFRGTVIFVVYSHVRWLMRSVFSCNWLKKERQRRG